MRALLQPHFSPKHLRALTPRVEALTTGVLNELQKQGPPSDLHAQLALPLPILVICELLGVPYSDRDQFRTWAEDAGNVCDHDRSEHGLAELFAYGRKLVERAKGILQRDLGLHEEQAYLTMQRQSRQKRRPMKEIAEAIILSDEVRGSSRESAS